MNFDVDAAFCISIKDRVDKQNSALRNCRALQNDLQFWLVDKDADNPVRGCYNSHRNIALYGLEHNIDRILVFEDDVEFIRIPSEGELARYNRHLLNENWELSYLGGLLGDIWLTVHPNIVGCHLFCTQSYIISRKGMQRLADSPFVGMPIDVFFRLNFKSYMLFPMITSQVSTDILESDIAQSRSETENLRGDIWGKTRRSQYISLVKNWSSSFIKR